MRRADDALCCGAQQRAFNGGFALQVQDDHVDILLFGKRQISRYASPSTITGVTLKSLSLYSVSGIESFSRFWASSLRPSSSSARYPPSAPQKMASSGFITWS